MKPGSLRALRSVGEDGNRQGTAEAGTGRRESFSQSAVPFAKAVEFARECEDNSCVTEIEDVKAAIARLPREQFERLAEWFDRQRETEFDRQIQADAKSGRLGKLYARLESENAGQPDEPLGEFLGRSKLP